MPSTPGVHDMVHYGGDTLVLPMTISDRIEGVAVARDITGYAFKGQIRQGGVLMGSFNFTILDAAAGVVRAHLTSEQVTTLTSTTDQTYIYDIQYTYNDGGLVIRQTLLMGTLTIRPEVTLETP